VNERKILFATIGAVSPKIENADLKFISNVDQLKEIMQGYEAGIVIASSIVSLEGITKSVTLLIPKLNPTNA
jgi:UDP-glucose 6-dehydrogenase